MPGGLDVACVMSVSSDGCVRKGRTLGPVLDVLDVFGGVLEIFEHMLRVGVKEAGAGCLALLDGHSPGAVLDTSSDVARKGVLISGQKVRCK